jgi:peptidoglycan/LPS O-acetylase OafA/YrhL
MIPLLFLVVPVIFRAWTGLQPTHSPDINSHFPSALDAFCLGILVAGLDNQGGLAKGWAALGTAGLILWALILPLMAWITTHADWHGSLADKAVPWLQKIASGCALFFIVNPKHPMTGFLSSPSLRWCGIISYEWYLFHQPVIVWARQNFSAHGDIAVYVAMVGGSILLSTTFSAAVYRWFSLPILKRGRGKK